MIDNKKEYILCAAIKRKVPRKVQPYHPGTNDICNIEIGYRHHDICQRFNDRGIYKDLINMPLSISPRDQGFYTSKGRFVDRYEAMRIAFEAGQVTAEVALSKNWIQKNITSLEPPIPVNDFNRFNPLFSEDLY